MTIFKNLLFSSSLCLLLLACGGGESETKTSDKPSSDSQWTDADKESAVRNCKATYKGYDEAKVAQVCDCYLQKVMELSPNPMKQSDIPLEKATEISVDCRKAVGLEM
ncbi:MAG: hypothetical protein HC913_06500 [Microscillaceae bacterium]|nr:hypothetical protein [Microscillaceae bacterium]